MMESKNSGGHTWKSIVKFYNSIIPLLHYSLTFVLICVLGSCATVSEDRLRKADAHYRLGISNLNETEIQGAFIEFKKATELNPSDKKSFNALGLIYLYLEDFGNAKDHFLTAIRIDPDYSEAYNNLGLTYERMKQFEKAKKAYKSALKNPFYPSPERTYNNLGRCLYRTSRYREAITAFKEALKRSPKFHLPYYGLALSYNASRQYGYAAETLSLAIKLDPFFQGDVKEAKKHFLEKKLKTTGFEKKDVMDFLEILHY